MREQLFERLLEASDRFAGELNELILARVEQLVAQANDAFEVALSAFASDLLVTDGAARRHDVRDESHGVRRSAQPRRKREISEARDKAQRNGTPGREDEEHASDAAASGTASGRASGHGLPSNRALQQGQDLPPSTSSRTTTNLGGEVADAAAKQTPPSTDVAPVSEVATSSTHRRSSEPPAKARICGCAPRGRHRKDCSLPNISTSPASDPTALTTRSSPATSPISRSGMPSAPTVASSTRSDRFAEIEAAKAQRELAKRERGERARSFIRRDGVRPTRGPVESDEPPQAAAGQLEPVATFEF